MPSLKIAIDHQRGAIIMVGVGVSMPRALALKKAGAPIPQVVPVRALIDTGASCTCVDPSVIAKLGINPTGNIPIHTPSTGGTPEMCNQFDIALVIATDTEMHVPSLIIPVIECNILCQGFEVLLGRAASILCQHS